jgi:protease I
VVFIAKKQAYLTNIEVVTEPWEITGMIKVLMMVAPEQFRDEELAVPRHAFLKEGWTVVTASTHRGEGTGMMGAQETFQVGLNDITNPSDYKALVIVGGYGAVEHLWHKAQLHELCRTMHAQGAVVSAICVSPVVLANAGLLSGKTASVFQMPESLEAFQQNHVTVADTPVTVDGCIVTANAPEVAQAFADAVIQAIQASVTRPYKVPALN